MRSLIVLLLLSWFVIVACACGWLSKETKAVAADIVDCTTASAKKTVTELGPMADAMLLSAVDAQSKIDWNPITDLAKKFSADVGGCVLADAVARALKPTPADPNAPKSSPLEVDRVSLRSGFVDLKAKLFPGKTFKTAAGDL
jgi:hypothetical protein